MKDNRNVFLTAVVAAVACVIGIPWLSVFAQNWREKPGDLVRMQAGVVKIRAGVEDGIFLTWQTGTGFVVRSDPDGHYIVTVTHVVKDADSIDVEYFHDRNVPRTAKIVHMQGADENGLVLLFVKGRPPRKTEILYPDARARLPGADVTAIGFPRRGQAWQATTGKISAVQQARISFTAKVGSGNSGGPLMNADGRVVGVVTSTKDGVGFATSSSSLASVLKTWDFELPMRPSEWVDSDPFPKRGIATFPLSRPTGLLFDRNKGYLMFGHVAEGKTPDGMPYWRSVVWRLDSKFRVKGRKYFRARSPGTSEIMETLRMPGGHIVVRERVARDVAPEIRTQKYDTRVAMLDFFGKPPGLTAYTAGYTSFFHEIFPTGEQGLVGISEAGWHTYFHNTGSGKERFRVKRECALYTLSPGEPGNLFCWQSGRRETKYLGKIEKRNLAGETLAKTFLPRYQTTRLRATPDGGVLVAIHWPFGRRTEARLLKYDGNLKPVWRYGYNMRGAFSTDIEDFWVRTAVFAGASNSRAGVNKKTRLRVSIPCLN